MMSENNCGDVIWIISALTVKLRKAATPNREQGIGTVELHVCDQKYNWSCHGSALWECEWDCVFWSQILFSKLAVFVKFREVQSYNTQ